MTRSWPRSKSSINAYSPPPLKAGYAAPSFYQMQVFILQIVVCLRGYVGHARMPLRIAPIPLTPSNDPWLGVKSQNQKLHRCALNGFLAPFSKLIGLTRILQPFARSLFSNILYHSQYFSFKITLKLLETEESKTFSDTDRHWKLMNDTDFFNIT